MGIGSRRIPFQPFVIYHGNAACWSIAQMSVGQENRRGLCYPNRSWKWESHFTSQDWLYQIDRYFDGWYLQWINLINLSCEATARGSCIGMLPKMRWFRELWRFVTLLYSPRDLTWWAGKAMKGSPWKASLDTQDIPPWRYVKIFCRDWTSKQESTFGGNKQYKWQHITKTTTTTATNQPNKPTKQTNKQSNKQNQTKPNKTKPHQTKPTKPTKPTNQPTNPTNQTNHHQPTKQTNQTNQPTCFFSTNPIIRPWLMISQAQPKAKAMTSPEAPPEPEVFPGTWLPGFDWKILEFYPKGS